MKVQVLLLLIYTSALGSNEIRWKVDKLEQWETSTALSHNIRPMKELDIGDGWDLMGDGALILTKNVPDNLFGLNEQFVRQGEWASIWQTFNECVEMKNLKTDLLIYGKPLDMTKGWFKFSGNPVFSGGDKLLPLNPKNVTDQTLLLPESADFIEMHCWMATPPLTPNSLL